MTLSAYAQSMKCNQIDDALLWRLMRFPDANAHSPLARPLEQAPRRPYACRRRAANRASVTAITSAPP